MSRKGTTAKHRTYKTLEALGWQVADVERRFSIGGRRTRSYDCFGADLLAVKELQVMLVQATTLSERQRHIDGLHDLEARTGHMRGWLSPKGASRDFELWCWRPIQGLGFLARIDRAVYTKTGLHFVGGIEQPDLS